MATLKEIIPSVYIVRSLGILIWHLNRKPGLIGKWHLSLAAAMWMKSSSLSYASSDT